MSTDVYPAICAICGRPIGVGVYSDDVHSMGVCVHVTCLPPEGKSKIVCIGKRVYRVVAMLPTGG